MDPGVLVVGVDLNAQVVLGVDDLDEQGEGIPFFQIDPGCLHAIKGGTLILETQQSSDVTYRFYDYGRLENGKPRALHIQQSLAVTRAPFQPHPIHRETVQEGGAQVTTVVPDSLHPYR